MNLIRMIARAGVRVLIAALIGVALASVTCAQAPRKLLVEVGSDQQVLILASNVTYGEVLRALQQKLGWEIEIPPLADGLKLSYARVEAKQPQDALADLLEGSGLGYALAGEINGSRILKVIVIPTTARELEKTQDTVPSTSIPDNAEAGSSLPLPTQAQTASASDHPEKSSALSLSEAVKAMGVPPGVSPGDVGLKTTFPISDAAKLIGVPPGVSPGDVGRKMTFPISDAANVIGVPPGVSAADVGKTITLPPPSSLGERP